MKYALIGCLFLIGCANHQQHIKSDMYLTEINKNNIGTVWFKDTSKGLLVEVDLKDLPQGKHGFHVHENPDCTGTLNKFGDFEYASNAGNHYDPHHTGKHLGPDGHGHLGDLPYITANSEGIAKQKFYIKNVRAQDFKNRSLIIHHGGDNYKDTPLPLGGGGKRIACGIIK